MSALVCIVVFALAGAQEPQRLQRLYLFDNNPVAPFVQTFPTLRAGKLVLELRNDFHEPVVVKGVFIGEGDSLLQERKELVPAETMLLDISEALRDLFAAEPQEQVVEISLSLEPRPEAQPEPSEYRVRFETGQFTDFTKVEPRAPKAPQETDRSTLELQTEQVEPQRVEGGNYPAVEPDLKGRLNDGEDDKPYYVPTGPDRGDMTPDSPRNKVEERQ